MIPVALMAVCLIWDNEKLNIMANTALPEGFIFYVAESRRELLKRAPEHIWVSFYHREDRDYYTFECAADIQPEGDGYRFTSADSRFISEYQRLLSDYMYYVRLKNDGDEQELMEELIGLSLSEEYTGSYQSWRKRFCSSRSALEIELHNVELAFSLDSPKVWRSFLSSDIEAFRKEYLSYNVLNDFKIAQCRLTHIYIGNQYCRHLFPKENELKQIIAKALTENITPVIVLAPMPQKSMGWLKELAQLLADIADENQIDIEIVVGDYGAARLIKELTGLKNIKLTAGVLLNKRKKDPRIRYLENGIDIAEDNSVNGMNDTCFEEYLMSELGISSVSYETCGYSIAIGNIPAVLHMPMYQTNTSDCVMHGLCRYGDRANREVTDGCEHYCEEHMIYYPENIPIIGIGNSVFSICEVVINDSEYINSLIEAGVKRIVLK